MTKIHARIAPLYHRGAEHIKVIVPYTKEAIQSIKQIEGRKWSRTHQCWYIPKTKEAYRQLNTFFQVSVEQKQEEEGSRGGGTKGKLNSKGDLPIASKKNEGREVEPQSVHLIPEKRPTTPQKFADATFGEHLFGMYFKHGKMGKVFTGEFIYIQKESDAWLRVFVPFSKLGWVNTVKNIYGRFWVKELACWKVPNVKESYRLLHRYIGKEYLKYQFTITADIPEVYRGSIQQEKEVSVRQDKKGRLNELQKEALQLLEDRLLLERKSHWTIKAYKHNLQGLLLCYPKLAPDEITKNQLVQYILNLVRTKKISESTQNQIINAVKAYWERVLGRGREWIDIPRPKKPKKMPNVLSTEEVIELINAPQNLKHKLALFLIYSAGLRKSELLNLLKRDINMNRRAIHIKGGKGKKDRYVVLAETVVPYLQAYLKQYRPTKWLFEGIHGGKYSGSSLQRIFEKAVRNTNVNPYATLHTLRHSYATHCIEQGHHIRQVQEALGHNSLKTTEIYLHITTDALRKLKSPLDVLSKK